MTRLAILRLITLLALIPTVGACASATENEMQALIEKAQASAERFSADPDPMEALLKVQEEYGSKEGGLAKLFLCA